MIEADARFHGLSNVGCIGGCWALVSKQRTEDNSQKYNYWVAWVPFVRPIQITREIVSRRYSIHPSIHMVYHIYAAPYCRSTCTAAQGTEQEESSGTVSSQVKSCGTAPWP